MHEESLTWVNKLKPIGLWTEIPLTGVTPAVEVAMSMTYGKNNKLYIYGKALSSPAAYSIDLTTNVVVNIAAPSEYKITASLISVDNFLYAYGGNNASGRTGSFLRYNVDTNTWSTLTAGQPASLYGWTVIGTDLYYFGGYGTETLIRKYSTSLNKWTLLTSFPNAGGASSNLFYDSTHIYVQNFFNTSTGAITNEIWSFTLSSQTWQKLTTVNTLPLGNFQQGCVPSGNLFYICGGMTPTRSGTIKKFYSFDPVALQFNALPDCPVAIDQFCFAGAPDGVYVYIGYTGGSPSYNTKLYKYTTS